MNADRLVPQAAPADTAPGSTGDPLLEALAAVARHLGRPVAPAAWARAIPSLDGRLAWADLPEAAARGGLRARLAEDVDVGALAPLALPALVRRRDGGVAAVLGRADAAPVPGWREAVEGLPGVAALRQALAGRDAGAAPNAVPASPAGPRYHVVLGGGATIVAGADLRAEADGACCFLQAEAFFDARDGLEPAPPAADWFWGALRANAPIYAMATGASLFATTLATLAAFYVMAVYDRVIPNRAMDTLAVLTAGVVAAYLFELGFRWLRGRLLDAAARRFDVAVGRRVFAHVLGLGPAARPMSAGSLAATVREFETLREFFTGATLAVAGDLPFLVVFVAALAWAAGPLAWTAVAAGLGIVAAGAAVAVPLAALTARAQKEGTARHAMLHEVASGLDDLQAVGGEAWARRRWERLLAQYAETTEASRGWSHMAGYLTATLQALAGVAVVAVAATMVADGRLSTGAMVAGSMLLGRALAPLAQVVALTTRFHSTRLAYDALDKLMRTPPAGAAALRLPRISGAIACRDVAFAYPTAPSAPKVMALDGLAFAVAPGEHVAILGRIGAGKSTLLALVLGLYAPERGHVLVDGVDVRQLDPAELRAQIGYVPQQAALFNGSIRENITLGHPGAPDEAILAAARIAGLDALLAGSAEGLGFMVGEGGRRLSGGMRQAVAIARAVLLDPPILLLDEPTSMLDQATEQQVLARLAAARVGRTTIVVTHRPAPLLLADRVIVLAEGRVAADGPKEAVLAALAGAPAPAS